MKDFLYHYIDLVTVALALSLTIFVSFRAWKKSGKRTRLGVLPFLFLGPLLLISCMATHVLEITYHAFDTGFTGKFSLRFHLYSLYLLPLVLGNAAFFFYRSTQNFVSAHVPKRKGLLLRAGLVGLIIFPLMWLTPLSFMMLFFCSLSIGASFLVHKPAQMGEDEETFTLMEAAAAVPLFAKTN